MKPYGKLRDGGVGMRGWKGLALLLCMVPAIALADGMYARVVGGGSVDTKSMGAQRAFLWEREDRTLLFVQSSVRGDLERFSWVLPLPAEPLAIEAAEEEIFDLLDILTRPRVELVEYASHSSWCMGGGTTGGDGGTVEDSEQVPPVAVLQSGEVGILDYSVVTSNDPEDLAGWLDQNGYDPPEGFAELAADYLEERFVFFLARVDRSNRVSAGDAGLPVLSFSMPVGTPMVYPMRLTALSAGEPVPLLLYMAVDDEEERGTPVPAAPYHTYEVWREQICSVADYREWVDEVVADHTMPNLVMQSRERVDRSFGYHYRPHGNIYEARPDEWTELSYPPLFNLADLGEQARQVFLDLHAGSTLSRYSASLAAEAMAADIRFERAEIQVPVEHVIRRWATSCPAEANGGCGSVSLDWVLMAMVLVYLWRAGRRAPKGSVR